MKIPLLLKSLTPIVGLVPICIFAWFEYQRFMTMPLNIQTKQHNYVVPPGSNLSRISKDLVQQNLINLPAFYLDLYGRIYNKADLIKAGEYHIQANTTLPELLDQLIEGKVIQYSHTIVEGITSKQLITSLNNDKNIALMLSKSLNESQISNQLKIKAKLGIDYNHLEGLFLPETYFFPAGSSDLDFLNRAHVALQIYLNDVWQNRAGNLPYKTPYEALIMASIIEKETGIAEERPEIAGVFVRRLRKGMRLQTDPTVIYGMGDHFNGNIRRKDLKTDTPYNTYTRFGLPPTPIALASKESIYAALHPAEGNSLYFVATGQDGRHYFSSNLVEHNKAVRKYQLKK